MTNPSENNHSHDARQVILASVTSILVNGGVHPIGTFKTYCMMGQLRRLTAKELYNGYFAVCTVDAASFSIAYVTNGKITVGNHSPLVAALAAGVLSSPIVAVGEGLMVNRQIYSLPYIQLWKKAFRRSGFCITALREIPFTTSLFYLSPLLEKKIEKLTGGSWIATAAVSGFTAGALAGFISTPPDLIKTRVQVSERTITIKQAIESVWTEGHRFRFFQGGFSRALHLGSTMAGMYLLKKADEKFAEN